jgi:crotonobetainyl-CoA:carnitine CoA-transferase CaiB-like acyl-CoA transferase
VSRGRKTVPGALAGVRVIEIAQEIQGPYAAMLLADLGADVVKLELPKTGDLSRYMRVRLVAGPDAPHADFSPYFLAMNRGKRSVTLDLKNPAGRDAARRLLGQADVLLTNYRPGVLERLGLGWQELSRLNPRLIFASGTSWGSRGPWRERPSRDTLAQAASGLMAKTGPEDGAPLPAGALIGDHSGGLSLALGVVAALFARERSGRGQTVDASIFGSVLALQAFEFSFASVSGVETARAGRGHQFLRGAWGAFRTRDGWLCLAGVDDKRWPAFCRILGIEHLRADPHLETSATRNYSGDRLRDALDAAFPARSSAEWLEALAEADVLAGPVLAYRDLVDHAQARANGYVTEIAQPEVGPLRMVGNPVQLGDTPLDTTRPAPELGQHTEEVLLESGFGWDEIERLRKAQAT